MIEITVLMNKAAMEGAAFIAYHVLFRGMIEQCDFSED
jgi:hypothetical protein